MSSFDFITSSHILDTKEKRPIIELKGTDTVETALHTLKRNGIISCPVWDDSQKKYFMVDTLDLVSAILRTEGTSIDNISQNFFSTQLNKVVNLCDWDPFSQTSLDCDLPSLLTMLAIGTHRCIVVDHDKIVGIISQSDVVEYIAKYINVLPEVLLQKRAKEIMNCPVSCISEDETALEGFAKISAIKYSGAAIVNKEKKLIGVLSASNLKELDKKKFASLSLSVREFLIEMGTIQQLRSLITCKEITTIQEILQLFVNNRVHRIFVIDEENRPIGIISLTDLIIFLAETLGLGNKL